MKKKKAFITGIGGQDGSYLAEYLLSLGYEVHGIIRRNSVPEHQESRVNHLDGKIHTYYGDMTDISSLEKVITKVMPDEIYNLAAQSHVRISFEIPQRTCQINALGVLNLLEVFHFSIQSLQLIHELFQEHKSPTGFLRIHPSMGRPDAILG